MRDSLDISMRRTLAGFCLLHLAVFVAFGLASGFIGTYLLPFIATYLSFNAFLYGFLRVFKSDFAIADTGRPLEKVNAANLITLFRVSSLPTLLFLVIASKDYPSIDIPLLVVVFIVFASDFVDGWVSRSTGEVTRIGKLMDSASDYLVLIVLSIVFYYFHRIDVWFLALVLGRLFLQGLFMGALFLLQGKLRPRTTFMGKAAVASIMLLYGVGILDLIVPVGLLPYFHWLEWAAAVVVGLSVVDKIVAFAQDLRSGAESK